MKYCKFFTPNCHLFHNKNSNHKICAADQRGADRCLNLLECFLHSYDNCDNVYS